MPWKTPAELSEDDMRAMLVYAMHRQQQLEGILVEAVLMLLSSVDEGPEPTEDEYRYTIDNLKGFLTDAYERLKRINDATDSIQTEVHSRN